MQRAAGTYEAHSPVKGYEGSARGTFGWWGLSAAKPDSAGGGWGGVTVANLLSIRV